MCSGVFGEHVFVSKNKVCVLEPSKFEHNPHDETEPMCYLHSGKELFDDVHAKWLGIEQIFGDDFVSLTRERFFIDRADTIRNGLNTYRT